MITKAQTEKLITKLEAHLDALKEIYKGLKEHHPDTEALCYLNDAIQGLDQASEALYLELNPA
jgi:hypothetical protein